ncbi:MAG TPA: TatD family hydrolase [Actinomycetota bacterium]|nr:TatD family hydrolase [Actinomycetota bacterium]
MWFDSHCHIHLCETGTSADVIERAAAAGVAEMLTVGIDGPSNELAVSLAADPRVYAAVGIHPNSADELDDAAAEVLEGSLTSDRVVAVGETGLDFYRDRVPADIQRRAFAFHIQLAKRYDKALIIHTRDSIDEAIQLLGREKPPERFVFHCWSGDAIQLRRALELGAHISFAGNVSFNSAQDLRDRASQVPADRLLVETDSPYLTPAPHRGDPNEPANVVHVGAAVAGAREKDPTELAELTTANARSFFGLA